MAWAFVSAQSTSGSGTTTKSVTTGNLLVVGHSMADGTTSPTISDGVNTWTQVLASPVKDTVNAAGVAMWWAVAATTASITVTITDGSTAAFQHTFLAEYSGNASSGLEDKSLGKANIAGSTTTNAMTTGVMTTASDGDLIVGYINDDGGTEGATQFTAGTITLSYTKRATASQDPGGGSATTAAVEDGVQTTNGSIQAAWTEGNARAAVAIQAAFKAAAAGGTGVISTGGATLNTGLRIPILARFP